MIAVVVHIGGDRWVGVAKRNCNDDLPDEARGRRIALARAFRGAAIRLPT